MGEIERVDVTAIESIERAAIDIAISTAKKYPRDMIQSRKRATDMACADEETASSCMYALPRGDKKLEGGSIRLAEIIASTWGNLKVASRIIGVDDTHVTAQAVCHDLEMNVMISIEKKRRITTSAGKRYNDDMITTTSNAAAAIAFRDAVFKTVPKSEWNAVYQAARQIAIGDASTLSERRVQWVGYLAKMGVFQDRLCGTLGIASVDDITMDMLVDIQGTVNLIKEGQTTVDEAFPPLTGDEGKTRNQLKREQLSKPDTARATVPEPTGAAVPASPPPNQTAKDLATKKPRRASSKRPSGSASEVQSDDDDLAASMASRSVGDDNLTAGVEPVPTRPPAGPQGQMTPMEAQEAHMDRMGIKKKPASNVGMFD